MESIYSQISTAIFRDRIYAERTLTLALASSNGDYAAEILVNLDDGTCTYMELIPILQKIADVDWFPHDEKYIPSEWDPEPDPDARKSFREWAIKSINNIQKNAHTLSSASNIHRALTSNDPYLIRTTLEMLAAEGSEKDNKLIPILEKIALKDVYKSFFYGLGYNTECHLRELANSVIEMIIRNSKKGEQQIIFNDRSAGRPDGQVNMNESQLTTMAPTESDEEKPDFFVRSCSICGALPDAVTVNKGQLPDELNRLEFSRLNSQKNSRLYRCPGCRTCYERTAFQQDGKDEERLIRLSWEQSFDFANSDDIKITDGIGNVNDEKNTDEFFVRSCSLCGSLPDDITVNTGRGFYLPDATHKLELKGKGDVFTQLYRCPGCGTYYERIDMPQFYGSGDNAEERLVRLSWQRSHEIDKSF